MTSILNFVRIFSVTLFTLIQFYCPAQNVYNKDLLLTTWKLNRMTYSDGKPYLHFEDLPKELLTFKSDSVFERQRGNDSFEGIWYLDGKGNLVFITTKFRGIQKDAIGQYFFKIKKLNSHKLVVIYFNMDRVGYDCIMTYKPYFGK